MTLNKKIKTCEGLLHHEQEFLQAFKTMKCLKMSVHHKLITLQYSLYLAQINNH